MIRALLVAVTALALSAPAAHADTIVVNAGGFSDEPDETQGTGPCATEFEECTLRAAIQTANRTAGKDTITFDLDPILARIKPKTALPPVTDSIVIDGWTAEGANPETGTPVVEIDGSGVPISDPGSHSGSIRVVAPYGLDVRAPNSEIRGLAIHGFPTVQLGLTNADSTIVQGNYFGLDSRGVDTMAMAIVGVYVYNTIQATIGGATATTRNTISGNWTGVLVTGGRSVANLIHGNFLGSDPSGLQVIGNEANGVLVTSNFAVGAAVNTLVAGNLIVGSDNGVRIIDATGTSVFNNWMGLTATGLGTDAMGKSAGNTIGVDVHGAYDTLVGGGDEAWGNIVAGSADAGIAVRYDSTDTRVEGNIVGTDPTGGAGVDYMGQPLRRAKVGIAVVPGGNGQVPKRTVVGGEKPTMGNLSANAEIGIGVVGGVEDVKLQRNLVGTDLPGFKAVPNDVGVAVGEDEGQPDVPLDVRVGTPGHGNVISGNERGVLLLARADGVRVQGNKVGPGYDNRPIGNEQAGIIGGGTGHVIEENVVAGNGGAGIAAVENASEIVVRANQVKANDGPGILAKSVEGPDVPSRVTVEHNFVTDNRGHGVEVAEEVTETVIRGNAVGRNDGSGVYVHDADDTTIDDNDIDENGEAGVELLAAERVELTRNELDGNEGDGVRVSILSKDVVIGWGLDGHPLAGCVERCNVIARNGGAGVAVPGDEEPITVRGNRFADNEGLAVDIGRTGPDALDARDVDEVLNTAAGVHGTRDPQTGEIAITGQLPIGFDHDARIDLYGLTEAQAAEAERARSGTFIGTTVPDERGNFVHRVAEPYASYMAIVVDEYGRTSESSLICSAHDGSSDQDGDALCDDWETDGIDYDADGTIDFELDQADPGEPDVHVEVDYTEGDFWGLGGDAAPSYRALTMVEEAFADAPKPVRLHLDLSEELEQLDAPLEVAQRGPEDRDDLRDLRYGNDTDQCDGSFGFEWEREARYCFARLGARGLAYRYAVFTDDLASFDAGAAAAGDALAIGVADWGDPHVQDMAGGESHCVHKDLCRTRVEAAVLMHELGHTLGLDHRGREFAPNYLSVMNPSFTFPNFSLWRPLDFSRRVLPTLDEASLNEPDGLRAAGDAEWGETVRMVYDPEWDVCRPKTESVLHPIDWNHDGDTTDVGVAASVNDPDGTPDTAIQECEKPEHKMDVIKGYDDWSNLQLDLRAVSSRYDQDERRAEGLESDLARLMAVTDSDGDGTVNTKDNCTQRANPGQEDADADGIGDACLALITERDVSLDVTSDDPDPVIGRPLTVTATLRNVFPLPATGLVTRVPVPEGFKLESFQASLGEYADGEWRVASLEKRSAATLTLRLVPEAEAQRSLIAELVAADQPDPDSEAGDPGDFQDDRVVLDFDPRPQEIVVGVSDARVQEGNRAAVNARVRLTLPRTWKRPVTVGYKTVAGTATADDFVDAQDEVTIAPGRQSAVIEVPVRGDRLVEDTERFTVALTVAGGALARDTATVTIVDNDAPARPGQLDYLGCVSEDRGPLSACQNTAAGLGEPTTVLAPDERFMYLIGEDRISVVEHGEPAKVHQCYALLDRVEGCDSSIARVYVLDAAFSPDGRFLYVMTRYGGTGLAPGIRVFARDPETGKLSKAACYNGISGCPTMETISRLDRVRNGRTALRADASQLMVISDAPEGEPGQIVTFERGEDGTLSEERCYDEGAYAAAPCLPLDASWGDDAGIAAGGPGWLVRTEDGLLALQRDEHGVLSPAACPACASFSGPGDVEVTPEAVYVSSEHTLTTLTPGLDVAGCVQDAGLEERRCPVRVEALEGLRGLRLSPDGTDLYAGARGGGVLALHRDAGGAITGGSCAVAETETSRCGDGSAGGGFAFREHEVWAARDGVLARFVRFAERGPGNRPPVCQGGATYVKPGVTIDVALRCSDVDGDPVRLEVLGEPKLGALSVDDEGRGRYRAGWVRGPDPIRFRANDGREWSAAAELTVTVDDLAPVCESGRQGFRAPIETRVVVTCTDPEGGPVTIALVDAPGLGTLSPDWVFRYETPASAETAFTFRATDEGGNVSPLARMELVLTYHVPQVPPDLGNPGPPPGGGNDRPRTTPGTSCRSNCRPDSSGYVPVTITCPKDASGACVGDVRICDPKGCRVIGKATAVLGKARFQVQPGKAKAVKVKLNRTLRTKLKKRRKLKVQLVVTVRPPGGQPLVTSKRVTLRAPKRR